MATLVVELTNSQLILHSLLSHASSRLSCAQSSCACFVRKQLFSRRTVRPYCDSLVRLSAVMLPVCLILGSYGFGAIVVTNTRQHEQFYGPKNPTKNVTFAKFLTLMFWCLWMLLDCRGHIVPAPFTKKHNEKPSFSFPGSF